MKRNLLLLVTMFICCSSFSQYKIENISMSYGEEITEEKGKIIKIIGETNNKIYALGLKGKDKYFLKIFNSSDMKLISNNPIVLPELKELETKICEIADTLEPRSHTSREFIWEMGKYLKEHSKKKDSLIETAYDNNVPIFCPAFTDSSAGFGLVIHQEKNPKNHMTIDSIREFRELTEIKMQSKGSGLFMIGGGVPKNFIQDTVICAELLGKDVDMHKYAVQITVADSRDGACSSSPLKEASSWGKVDVTKEQMVFAEATSVLPLIASDAFHRGEWKNRSRKNFAKIFG